MEAGFFLQENLQGDIQACDDRRVIVAIVTKVDEDEDVGHRSQSQLSCVDEIGIEIRRQDEEQHDEVDPTSSTNENVAGDTCALDSEIDWNPWWLTNGSIDTTISILYIYIHGERKRDN